MYCMHTIHAYNMHNAFKMMYVMCDTFNVCAACDALNQCEAYTMPMVVGNNAKSLPVLCVVHISAMSDMYDTFNM